MPGRARHKKIHAEGVKSVCERVGTTAGRFGAKGELVKFMLNENELKLMSLNTSTFAINYLKNMV